MDSFLFLKIVRFLHFLGLASLVGGTLSQMKAEKKMMTPAMLHGAVIQLVTGIALAAMIGSSVNGPKIMTKMGVLMVILLGILSSYKKEVSARLFFAVFALSVLEIALAIFWP